MHYYQFYIADYRKDTSHLTRLEHSIYRDLIDWYYLDEKPISKDMSFVSRRLKLSTKSEIESFNNVIQDFFVEQDDGYHHQKIDDEICEYHKKCDVNSTNGKKGGRPKGKRTQTVSERLANAMPTVSDIEPNQKAISNQYSVISKHKSVINKTTKYIYTPDFEEFWLDYPKHEGKSAAFKEWKKIAPDQELQDKIKSGVLEYRQSRKVKEGFIKDCVNWLKGKHWEDDIINVQPMMTVTETPWQKAGRLKAAEFSPRIAAKDPNDLYIADDMTYFNTIKEIQNDTTP